jgi:hypothetical protein
LYVEDLTVIPANLNGFFEISSAGIHDAGKLERWTFNDMNLSTGWNHIKLQLGSGRTKSPDINYAALNYFRLAHTGASAPSVLKLDNLRFTNEEPEAFVSVAATDQTIGFGGEAGDRSIAVSTNTALSVASTESWCTPTLDGTTVKIAVSKNTSGSIRHATVTVSAISNPAKKVEIAVTQAVYVEVINPLWEGFESLEGIGTNVPIEWLSLDPEATQGNFSLKLAMNAPGGVYTITKQTMPINASSFTHINFDFYIANLEATPAVGEAGFFEISSAGAADAGELRRWYFPQIAGLHTGWNNVKLEINTGAGSGLRQNAVNYFRFAYIGTISENVWKVDNLHFTTE